MENKQKALEMAAAMQQKEKSGSLLWCVAEDLKATIQSMNEEEAKVIVADLEAGTHDLKTCEKAIHDYANKHKSGGSACCPGPAVPGILRVHFGLPESGQAAAGDQSTAPAQAERPKRQRAAAAAEQAHAEELAKTRRQAEETAARLNMAADESTVRFGLLFDQLQDAAGKVLDLADAVQQDGETEKAGKFRAALYKALLALANEANEVQK